MPKITALIQSENHGADRLPMFLISSLLHLLPSTNVKWTIYHRDGLHGLLWLARVVALWQVDRNSEESPVVLAFGTKGAPSEQSILQWARNPEGMCLQSPVWKHALKINRGQLPQHCSFSSGSNIFFSHILLTLFIYVGPEWRERERERDKEKARERARRRELALSVTTLAALSRWSFLCSRGDHDSKSKGGRERKTDRENTA